MDRYSKTVLTIIAIALLWNVVKDLSIVENAMASTGVVEVKIVSMNLNQYQPIPVQVLGKIDCKVE